MPLGLPLLLQGIIPPLLSGPPDLHLPLLHPLRTYHGPFTIPLFPVHSPTPRSRCHLPRTVRFWGHLAGDLTATAILMSTAILADVVASFTHEVRCPAHSHHLCCSLRPGRVSPWVLCTSSLPADTLFPKCYSVQNLITTCGHTTPSATEVVGEPHIHCG